MKTMISFLRNVPFFQQLDDNAMEQLAQLCQVRTYSKGQTIFLEEEQGDECYIIHSGVVNIYRLHESREIILAIFREGDFFGEMAILEDEQVRSASAKAVEQTQLYILTRRDLDWLMNENPQIAIRILKTAFSRLRKANELITDLTILDARVRLARGLMRLTASHGSARNDASEIVIDLKLTHQQLADMTGTVRETVARIMSEWQNQGVIQVDKKRIRICDISRMEQLIQGAP